MRGLWIVSLLWLTVSNASAQTLSIDQVEQIIRAVHDGERMNWSASSTRDQRNSDWAQVIGVVHHGHPTYNPTPDPSWCIKDAGNGRPQSDDVVVQCAARTFWDCVPSAGADGYRISCSGHGAERLPSNQNVYAPPRPTRISGGTTAPPVDTTGTWTAAHLDVVRRLGSTDTKRIAEQLRASFPVQEWGQKRADNVRPVSSDVIAVRANGRLTGVRVVPSSNAGVIGDISNQVFVAVAAVDHLGTGVVTPNPTPAQGPNPTPTPPAAVSLQPVLDAIAALAAKVDALVARAAAAVDLSDVTARIDAVSVQVDQARQEIGALTSKPIAVDWPEYSGVLLGQRVTLRPRR